MTDNTDIRQLADLPIANVLFPDKAGPRMLPYNVPIAAGVEFVLDLMQAQLTAKENRVQAIEVDNTRGGADVIIQMGFQRIQVCAGELQLIPLYVSGSPLVFYCDVANVVPVKFFNVPMPAYTRRVRGTRMVRSSAQANGEIIPAIANRSIIITGVNLYLSGDAAQAVAGTNVIGVQSSTGSVYAASVRPYIPAASPATPTFGQCIVDRTDIYVKMPEGVAVRVVMSSSLTAGFIEINAHYTYV